MSTRARTILAVRSDSSNNESCMTKNEILFTDIINLRFFFNQLFVFTFV